MDSQTFGLLLITLAFSGVPAILLMALRFNRMNGRVLGAAMVVGFVTLSVGTLYLLGKFH